MKNYLRTLFALLVLAALFSACGGPAPTPTPVSEATPVSMATPAPPTATPPPLAPRVRSVQPPRGEELAPGQPVQIVFDRPVDAASVEMILDDDLQGDISVSGDTVSFQPTAFKAGQRYVLQLDVAAASSGLRSGPLRFPLLAQGYLQVANTTPGDGNETVATDTVISIAFNRPVTPLTSVGDAAGLPQPLTLEPAVAGTGEWLNTSIYLFRPDEPLLGGALYTATVADLVDLTGATLAAPYTFSFRTELPIVLNVEPAGDLAAPSSPITITFSQPMDAASTAAATSVRVVGGATLAATAQWSEDGRVLVLQPDRGLPFGERIEVDVAETARGRGGEAALRRAGKGTFTVAPYPAVLSTTPRNGQENVEIDGGVTFQFSAPILEETLKLSISPEISATQVYTWFNPYDRIFSVHFPRQPQTEYTVTLAAGISDPYGNLIQTPTTLRFRTGDRQPFLNLLSPGIVGVYNVYTETALLLHHVNLTDIDLSLYRLTPQQFANLRPEEDYEAWRLFTPSPGQLLRQWRVTPAAERNAVTVTREMLAGAADEPLTPGLYFLTASSPQIRYQQYDLKPRLLLVVSRYNVVIKRGVADALVWVTDLASGQPVADAPVALYESAVGMAASGRTAADGVFRASLAPMPEPWRPSNAFVGAEQDPGWASSQWRAGISPWEFDLPADFYEQPYRVHLYTERPLYRAGDSVHFRAILRGDTTDTYTLPQGLMLTARLRNPRGDVALELPVTTDAFGAVHGSFALAAETELGMYSLELQMAKDFSAWTNFLVAAFRKPEYELQTAVAPAEVIATQPAQASVTAGYFFGGAVKNAAVRWTVYGGAYGFSYASDEPWSFSDFNPNAFYEPYQPSFSAPIASGQGETDAQGQFSLAVPTELSAETAGGPIGSSLRTVEFTITDANDQEVSATTGLVVHAGEVYPGVRPDRYVGAVQEAQIAHVIAVDALSRQPQAGQVIEVEISRLVWRTVRERVDGRLRYASQVDETPVLSQSLTTGSDGRGQLVWQATEPGQYLIRASARDRLGNRQRSAAFTYISGEGYAPWQVTNDDRLKLVADRDSYAVGDTARVLVPSPFQGEALALVTIERRGILSHELRRLQSNSETLEIPIRAEYAPNVFLAVALISPPATGESPTFKIGLLQLNVDVSQHLLTLDISADPAPARPGDSITYRLRATDFQGKPVRAQISLALVDKALLSLRPEEGMSIVDAFWSRRGLGVQTGVSLVVSLNRVDEAQSKGTKGGGGGGDGFADLAAIDVRSDFRDLAFWQADVETGADGEASVSVPLPDNLTTWRLKAVAVTQNTAVTEVTHELLVTKPLFIRPVLPRFVVHGDRFQLGVIVQNNSDSDQEVELLLEELAGLKLEDAAAASHTLAIPAGQLVRVDVPVQVADLDPATRLQREEVVVRLAALTADSAINDRIELRLPVRRYSSPETTTTAGVVPSSETRFEAIALPDRFDPTQGDLTLRLEPSLAAGMAAGLDYLTHFEYECTEQTVSRFLPNILTARALTALDLSKPEIGAELDAQVGIALQRLLTRQNPDGGWGWFAQEKSSPYTSAYVLFGLSEARLSGYTVDAEVLARGAAFLRRQLRTPADLHGYALNQQAFFLYVLDRYAQAVDADAPLADVQLLFAERERLALYAQGYLALALHRQGAADQAQSVLDALAGRAILSASGAHWEEGSIDWWTMNTDTRTTSVILAALTAIQPDHPLGPNVVRWLMSARTADRWQSTHETAWALISLTDWLVASGELQANYDWRAQINGSDWGSGRIRPADVYAAETLHQAIGDLAADALNILLLERSAGPGQLYYTAQLRVYLPVPDLKPVSRGLTIARRYTLATLSADPKEDKSARPAITSAQIGDIIEVELTLVVPTTMHYLLVEDPIPAGTEPVDVSFATTSRQYSGPSRDIPTEEAPWWYRWWWNPASFELKDDKVALFATELPPGTYTYHYQLRASIAGEFNVLPPRGEMMYFPEVFGHGAGSVFTITRP